MDFIDIFMAGFLHVWHLQRCSHHDRNLYFARDRQQCTTVGEKWEWERELYNEPALEHGSLDVVQHLALVEAEDGDQRYSMLDCEADETFVMCVHPNLLLTRSLL